MRYVSKNLDKNTQVLVLNYLNIITESVLVFNDDFAPFKLFSIEMSVENRQIRSKKLSHN
ncbi:hypothetical protein [Flavobacterium sp. JAS]|uniref:hypothetical protein n=1 Tax=Flavobacterium sp. JAS TaxID=2897329 RepID=UPI001E61D05A|nr:hypothetical protein [Flavobacterium sp. JAS]MCD0468718.1 hypothetical protein [Flavobacterium sp. JAS]